MPWFYLDSSYSWILQVGHMLLLLNLWNIFTLLTQKSLPFCRHVMPELVNRLLSSIPLSNLCPLLHLGWCHHISHPKTHFHCVTPYRRTFSGSTLHSLTTPMVMAEKVKEKGAEGQGLCFWKHSKKQKSNRLYSGKLQSSNAWPASQRKSSARWDW